MQRPEFIDRAIGDFVSTAGDRLRRLWLDGADMRCACVERIAKSCPRLSLLSLSFCDALTDRALLAVKVSIFRDKLP